MLGDIQDQRVKQKILDRVNELQDHPELLGDPLTDDLAGCRSLRAVGQRYRVIYRVEHDKGRVLVVAVGIRKEHDKRDVYAVAKRLISLRLLEPAAIYPRKKRRLKTTATSPRKRRST